MRGSEPAWKTWPAPTQGDDLWSWQDGRCAWCGTERGKFVRDHCHMTGLIRGLLCGGCNTFEGVSTDATTWAGWRSGDNTANAVGHYEIYVGPYGTAVSPQSALHYFHPTERAAWFELVVAKLTTGEMEWPTEVPWIDTALARKAASGWEMKEALGRAFRASGGDAA